MLTIEQLASRLPKVRDKRDGWLACCPYPDHKDDTPSFSVSVEGYFYCFGCGKKGNFARLLHDIEGWSWKKAIAHAELITKCKSFRKLDVPIFSIEAMHRMGTKIEPETISNGLLGLYEVDWVQGYQRYLQGLEDGETEFPPWVFPFRKGFLPDTLIKFEAGYDKDFQRITVPVRRMDSRLAGFCGRTCVGDPSKWMIYPPLHTTHHLYNFDKRRKNRMILVEGPWDVWHFHQCGYENVVAVMTSHVSDIQLDMLAMHVKHCFIMFDRDKAGKQGALKSADKLVDSGVIVDIAMSYPKSKVDVKTLERDEIASVIEGSIPYPSPSALEVLRSR